VLGYDAAGVVEALGPGVHDFAVGDEVYYTPEITGNQLGTYAELNAVPAAIVAKKPATLTFEQAAAVPLAGGTAWEAIVRRLRVTAGETILVHGGAGGVGSFAVQFAKAAGARVLATASAANQAFLRELGVDVPIDYKAEDVVEVALRETHGKGVDATLDTAGGNIPSSLKATRTFGRLATILGVSGDLSAISPRNQTLFGVFLSREKKRLDEMTPLFERGLVRPVIDKVVPLDQLKWAHERLDSGHGRGKVILSLAGS
jgi:NADPH2:quinone reductase